MEGIPDLNRIELERQRGSVTRLYDKAAPIYDELFEGKTEQTITPNLVKMYEKYGIKEGTILDIGCGTGKLMEYLGGNFIYKGIELSPLMAEGAKKRGYEVHVGPVEEQIQMFADKSVDH